MFFRSQAPHEQRHIINALRFELGKVEVAAVRERMVYMLAQVDQSMANEVADELGIKVPQRVEGPLNKSIPADVQPKELQPTRARDGGTSPALSMANTTYDSIKTRKIAALVADGVDEPTLRAMIKALKRKARKSR
jgi:catalase